MEFQDAKNVQKLALTCQFKSLFDRNQLSSVARALACFTCASDKRLRAQRLSLRYRKRFFEISNFRSQIVASAPSISNLKLEIENSFPVVVSRGSHPFPSRTRKLSLLEPMVLHGQLCGRVGSRRDYYPKPAQGVTLSGLFV